MTLKICIDITNLYALEQMTNQMIVTKQTVHNNEQFLNLKSPLSQQTEIIHHCSQDLAYTALSTLC